MFDRVLNRLLVFVRYLQVLERSEKNGGPRFFVRLGLRVKDRLQILLLIISEFKQIN